MKRLKSASLLALTLSLALLFSACSPAPIMAATLTYLPYYKTPPTSTPYPTFTPRPTGTPTPSPEITAVEAVGTEMTLTVTPGGPTLDSTVAAALTLAPSASGTETPSASCPPFTLDENVPDPNTPEKFIGLHFDPLNPLNGMKWKASGLLEAQGWSWADIQVQNREMYFIQKMVCRNTAGVTYWEIADALTLPELDSKTHEVLVNLCFYGDQAIPFALAYGPYDPSQPAKAVTSQFVGWPIQVKKVWQMKDKFIPLDPQGISCMLQEPQKTQ